jgi:hypothetical protein
VGLSPLKSNHFLHGGLKMAKKKAKKKATKKKKASKKKK